MIAAMSAAGTELGADYNIDPCLDVSNLTATVSGCGAFRNRCAVYTMESNDSTFEKYQERLNRTQIDGVSFPRTTRTQYRGIRDSMDQFTAPKVLRAIGGDPTPAIGSRLCIRDCEQPVCATTVASRQFVCREIFLCVRWRSDRGRVPSFCVNAGEAVLRDFTTMIDIYAEAAWGVELSGCDGGERERDGDGRALRTIARRALNPYEQWVVEQRTGIRLAVDSSAVRLAAGLYQLAANLPVFLRGHNRELPAGLDPTVDQGLKIYWAGRRLLEQVGSIGPGFLSTAAVTNRGGEMAPVV